MQPLYKRKTTDRVMSTPEEKQKKRRRIRSHIAKDLGSPRYRQRVKPNEKPDTKVKIQDLTHAQLVKLIQEERYDEE